MYRICLAGGIGSGKSTVARKLEGLGAARIDLDQVSRAVLEPSSLYLQPILDAFGHDLLTADKSLNRQLLAERAFATPELTAKLEALELPGIATELAKRLHTAELQGASVCVVEVPVLSRLPELHTSFDEVVSCVAPRPLRRARAIARGMSGEDFDARDKLQPSEAYIREHSDTLMHNNSDLAALYEQVESWWAARQASGWRSHAPKH